ncbi:hypothetical protein H2201_003110 [Coniosporium apollinis]|uniref:FAD-binding domain-containing protein n=2 Tax=Coniosporium TaxID=2810619 RepID=A0ABQ9NWH8_9PEZI|nr:hypothetical protein H2199_008451 [Cladosporium sp. JES 115]KAJ9666706.1 hypothetical protein H2201_003110 [Coniosporium apollinis]
MTVPPSKPDHFRVIIAGGGIAGLSLANALQHANIDYVLLEARSLIAPQVGASIGLAPNGSRILDQLGCYDDIRELTLPVVWVGDHYENGDYIYPKSNAIQLIGKRHAYEFCFLDRQLVLEVLYDHIIDKTKVLLNKRLASVDHGPWGVKVYCTDGTYYEGDILAGADGVYSPVRQEMWRVADNEEPGAIPVEDKTAMQTEYKCLFGISSPTPGLESVSLDVTYTKDFSTMVVTCKGDRVYFFLFKRLDKVYGADTVLKFSKEEAEQFGEQCRDVNLMPGGSVKFGDVWNNRMSFTLVALEEAEYNPTLIGLAAQLLGIGVVGPVYFFIHYLCAQISNFQASDMRLTDLAYTRSILPVMVAGYYVPHFLSHLHPSLAARHDWTWIWQMFPVWVMLCQRLLAYTILPNTVQSDRINDPKRDVPVIRLTIGICVALSALVWLSTLAMSPYTPMTMFIPEATAADRDWTAVARNVLQYDQLFSFGSALLWLGYLFGDLKRAGMVQQSWIKMVMAAAATVLALGPGAAVGIAWMWREEILVSKRHKSAVVAVRDDSVLGAEKRENGTL